MGWRPKHWHIDGPGKWRLVGPSELVTSDLYIRCSFPHRHRSRAMFRARASFSRFSKRLKQFQTSPFCSKSRIGTNKNSNNGEINGINKVESDFSSYKEAYKQLDNLDFMTASKILFTEPPKKKEFGYHFLFSIFVLHDCLINSNFRVAFGSSSSLGHFIEHVVFMSVVCDWIKRVSLYDSVYFNGVVKFESSIVMHHIVCFQSLII